MKKYLLILLIPFVLFLNEGFCNGPVGGGAGGCVGGTSVSDTPYDATSWNGVTSVAPSKNAVRDKIESMGAGGGAPTDAFYLTTLANATLTNEVVVSANGASLITAANYAAMRALLDLEPGTDFYSIAAADVAFEATVTEGSLSDSVIVSADVKDGELVNADINAAAAIAQSKLATLVGANEVYSNGWNADTGLAEKDDIYDYLHGFDSDDDGSFTDEPWYSAGSERFSQGLTIQTFTGSDATPDVTNGGTSVVQLWRSVDTTTITDFDDGDNHSEFSDGDSFLLLFNSAQVIDCSDNANIKGHGNNNYTGAAGEWALVVWDDTNNYWVFKPSETKSANFTTLRVPNDESADGTLANLGEIHVRGDEDRFSLHMGAGGEIAGEATKSMLEYGCWSCDPGSAYDSDAEWFLFEVDAEVWPNGIIIDEWEASCNVDPDVEINADLRYADAWIGLANPADIDEIDTTNGTSTEDTDANINGGSAVAAGKVIYIGHDGDPEGTGTQFTFCMKWHGEED